MTKEEKLLQNRLKRLRKQTTDAKVQFKNYKTMCEALGLPIKSGNSKPAQIKHLSYFCDIEKAGQKYLFTKVNDDPDRLRLEENLLVAEMEQILLHMFLENKSPKILLPQLDLFQEFGFANKKFENNEIEEKFMLYNNISEKQLANYKTKSNERFKRILSSALKKMQDCCYITCFDTEIIIEEGKGSLLKREARIEEIQQMRELEYEILEKMRFKSKNEIHMNYSKRLEFYRKRYDAMRRKNPQWLHYQKGYKIILSKEHLLLKGIEKNSEEIFECKKQINERIIVDLNESAKKSYHNYVEEKVIQLNNYDDVYKFYDSNKTLDEKIKELDIYKKKGEYMEDSYLENYQKYISEFIRIGCEK